MRKRGRRNHSAVFKAKVALAALKGDQILMQLAQRFDVHPNQVTHWKAQLLERAAEVFDAERGSAGESVNVKELHAKIGQRALENDFLAGALGRLPAPRAAGNDRPRSRAQPDPAGGAARAVAGYESLSEANAGIGRYVSGVPLIPTAKTV